MRTNNLKLITGAAAILSLLVIACKKEKGKEVALETINLKEKALVQVYDGILNSARNYVYVDGVPVTGAALAFNSLFPATPAVFAIDPGLRTFLVRDTASSPTMVPLGFTTTLQAGKYYTVFLYDTLNTPKQKTVVNDVVVPADSTARIRFANFIFTRTAVPNVDLFSKRRNANVFTNVAITDVTGYLPHPSASKTIENDTLFVRETGTMNLLATLNGFAPVRKRSYTLVFRGRYQTTGTTGIARLLTAVPSN